MDRRVLSIVTLLVAAGCARSQTAVVPSARVAGSQSAPRIEYILHVLPIVQFTGGKDGGPIGNVAGGFGGLTGDPAKALFGTLPGSGDPFHPTCGVVYELKPDSHGVYHETVLHHFGSGSNDGCTPLAPLVMDDKQNVYGTTSSGPGGFDNGTVFKLSPQGTGFSYSVIHRFNITLGYGPRGPLLIDANGDIFGTTWLGGRSTCGGTGELYDCGLVYKLTPSSSSYSFSVVHYFNGSDGASPFWGVVEDASGDLFGTVSTGPPGPDSPNGAAFELVPSAKGYTEKTIHIFGVNDYNASNPNGLLLDSSGTLFGTTFGGGIGNGGVFALVPSGGVYNAVTLHVFGGVDGAAPESTPVLSGGVLYGNTTSGGNGCPSSSGCGVIYSIGTNGSNFTVQHQFTQNGSVGYTPGGPLLRSGVDFYGTTEAGGAKGFGAAYKLHP